MLPYVTDDELNLAKEATRLRCTLWDRAKLGNGAPRSA